RDVGHQTAEQTEAASQAGQKREATKPKVVDPHGAEGVGQAAEREQMARMALTLVTGAGQEMGQVPLSPEELLRQLAGLGIGGATSTAGPVQPVVAETGARTTAAILPSASLALLAERLMAAQVGNRSGGAVEALDPVGQLLAEDGAVGSGAGLRAATSGKGGGVTGSGAPLSTDSPQFADELMDRVGRMRVLSRGGGGRAGAGDAGPAGFGDD
ncbi:MAG: hypothetical protein H7838_11250, partial [Magnetococcus sp. DMHC-8]